MIIIQTLSDRNHSISIHPTRSQSLMYGKNQASLQQCDRVQIHIPPRSSLDRKRIMLVCLQHDNLIYYLIQLMLNTQQIVQQRCSCSVCLSPTNKQITSTKPGHIKNCLQNFLELFPKNFPLAVANTAFPKSKIFFYNKFTNRLMSTVFTKITDHFPLATNVLLFYQQKCVIAHKYQLMKEDNSYIYVQSYSKQIPTQLCYQRQQIFLDEILSEKMPDLLDQISHDQYFNLSEQSRDFLTWVHKDYGDTIFCKFMTKFYCLFAEKINQVKLIKAEFQWIIQKIGLVRLVNVKNIVLQKQEKTLTFQQEYQQKVLEKIGKDSVTQIKLFNVSVKKQKINFRVNVFKNEIRDIFQKQKNKILQKTQKERTVQSKTPSDDVARLFLPKLQKYSSLRQVLNDERKFKSIVLGIDQGCQKNKKPPNATKQIQTKPNFRTKSLKSNKRRIKTEYY